MTSVYPRDGEFPALEAIHEAALERLPRDAATYLESGAGIELTLRANREAFSRWVIRSRPMSGVTDPKTKASSTRRIMNLDRIVGMIVDLMVAREKDGKEFGVIVLAEGLAHLPHVLAVRGRGLMLACELDVAAPEVMRRALLEQRRVTNATGPSTPVCWIRPRSFRPKARSRKPCPPPRPLSGCAARRKPTGSSASC